MTDLKGRTLSSMPGQRLPKIIFCGEMQDGAQKKRFKDTLKTSLIPFDIDPVTREAAAQNRTAWDTTLRKAVATYVESRTLGRPVKWNLRRNQNFLSSLLKNFSGRTALSFTAID